MKLMTWKIQDFQTVCLEQKNGVFLLVPWEALQVRLAWFHGLFGKCLFFGGVDVQSSIFLVVFQAAKKNTKVQLDSESRSGFPTPKFNH